MEGYFGFNEMKALQELISPQNDELDLDNDLPQTGTRKLGPGDIGSVKADEAEYTGPHAVLQGKGDDIWHTSEVSNAHDANSTLDPRIIPEYEMKFKQQVSTEDVFLGMGFKTPSTSSCEWLIISVKLPGEAMENIELSIESDCIDIRSPRYRLQLPTPHSVNPNESSANWQSDLSTLNLTLKLIRELDADLQFQCKAGYLTAIVVVIDIVICTLFQVGKAITINTTRCW
ncbi:hypothetical protein PV326_004671, partial [Microctonus aethiopoides]